MPAFLNPEKVLKRIKLKDDMTAADFGCGSGGWVIPLAKRLEEGMVFAVDILQEPLSALQSKADIERILNIKTILDDVEKEGGLEITLQSCDLVLMTNLLFEVEDKKTVFKEAKRILKQKGKILIVDWIPEAPLGPTKGRVAPEEVKELAKEMGFILKEEFQAGAYHFGLIFEKP